MFGKNFPRVTLILIEIIIALLKLIKRQDLRKCGRQVRKILSSHGYQERFLKFYALPLTILKNFLILFIVKVLSKERE